MQLSDLRALGALLRRFGQDLEDLATGMEVQVGRLSGSDGLDELVSTLASADPRLELDLARREVRWKGKRLPQLTGSEFSLIAFLSSRPRFVRSRAQVLDAIMPEQLDASDRCIDSHIKRIRRKFREVELEFAAIRTLHGIGYTWELEN